MSRTRRKYITGSNYREARGGRATVRAQRQREDALPVGAFPDQHFPQRGYRNWYGPSTAHGGMLMSPHNTGMWGDEYDPGDTRTKRAVKRSERARARQEADAEVVYTSSDTDDDSPLACPDCGREFCVCAWRCDED